MFSNIYSQRRYQHAIESFHLAIGLRMTTAGFQSKGRKGRKVEKMCEGRLVLKFTEKPSCRDRYTLWPQCYRAIRTLTKLNRMLTAVLQTLLYIGL